MPEGLDMLSEKEKRRNWIPNSFYLLKIILNDTKELNVKIQTANL